MQTQEQEITQELMGDRADRHLEDFKGLRLCELNLIALLLPLDVLCADATLNTFKMIWIGATVTK